MRYLLLTSALPFFSHFGTLMDLVVNYSVKRLARFERCWPNPRNCKSSTSASHRLERIWVFANFVKWPKRCHYPNIFVRGCRSPRSHFWIHRISLNLFLAWRVDKARVFMAFFFFYNFIILLYNFWKLMTYCCYSTQPRPRAKRGPAVEDVLNNAALRRKSSILTASYLNRHKKWRNFLYVTKILSDIFFFR